MAHHHIFHTYISYKYQRFSLFYPSYEHNITLLDLHSNRQRRQTANKTGIEMLNTTQNVICIYARLELIQRYRPTSSFLRFPSISLICEGEKHLRDVSSYRPSSGSHIE